MTNTEKIANAKKRIDELESKLMKDFDEQSYSDLIELKSKINKE